MRPVREELKCRDFDLYRATYCGLCRTMRRRCGIMAPMVLNFDFTFLAVMLAPEEGEQLTCRHRCHIWPVRRCMCRQSPALELAADESVILAYWQLRDKMQDESFLRGLGYRILALLLRPAYRRAAGRQPSFAQTVTRQLSALHELEQEGCPSLDRAADTFAVLLRSAAPSSQDEAKVRAMDQLLYHLGRWIYLIDARDDLEEDCAAGNYNPILLRYGQQPCDEQLALTLDNSLNLMRSACSLLDFGRQTRLIENVMYLGLPLVQRAVFDGSWKQMKKQKIWRNKV